MKIVMLYADTLMRRKVAVWEFGNSPLRCEIVVLVEIPDALSAC